MRLTSIEFSFDPCNIYRDGPRGVGYPADARSVGDSHPSCFVLIVIVINWLFILTAIITAKNTPLTFGTQLQKAPANISYVLFILFTITVKLLV